MLLSDEGRDTSEELTAESAVPVFEDYLSQLDADETQEEPETPPTLEVPESEAESEDVEANTEPADSDEDQTANETDEEAEEATEAPADDDSIDPSVKVRVKIDGVEEVVTLEEALKGYSRTAVFTRKTQELAEQRKAFEADATGVREERQKYAERLTQLEQAITEATPQEPDWDKVQQENPDQFPMLRAQWSLHKERMAAITAERRQAQEAVLRDHEASRQMYLQAEQEKLVEALPEWKNPETAKAAKTSMVAYVKDMGYSVEEISNVTDHRLLVLINKAMKYDKAQEKKPLLKQRIEKVKTATPGPARKAARPMSKVHQVRQRLAKTGSADDAAAAFELMLDDE